MTNITYKATKPFIFKAMHVGNLGNFSLPTDCLYYQHKKSL